MKFTHKLLKIIKRNHSFVCVGLDSDLEKIPHHFLKKNDPIFEFNKAIILATNDLVCAYKLNIAFYEASGSKGLKSLKKSIDYLKKKHPQIPIIVDAKRGDIDNTNLGYIKLIFDYLNADAVTLHPYLGKESLLPFLSLKDKFFFILCRTSNPGAGEFQDLKVKGEKLYQYVARRVSQNWNKNQNCGLVTGATYPQELKIIRQIVGQMPLLIPGIGQQGGDLKNSVRGASGGPFLINSSRGIIFADKTRHFDRRAREETEKLKSNINQYL